MCLVADLPISLGIWDVVELSHEHDVPVSAIRQVRRLKYGPPAPTRRGAGFGFSSFCHFVMFFIFQALLLSYSTGSKLALTSSDVSAMYCDWQKSSVLSYLMVHEAPQLDRGSLLFRYVFIYRCPFQFPSSPRIEWRLNSTNAVDCDNLCQVYPPDMKACEHF